MELCHYILNCVAFCVSFDGYMYTEKSVVDLFGLNCLYCVIQYIWIYEQKFWISVNAEVQNFCVSFDGYMYTEKSVVDLFWIKLIVLCNTVHMDLWTQFLDFCECRSTKIMSKF